MWKRIIHWWFRRKRDFKHWWKFRNDFCPRKFQIRIKVISRLILRYRIWKWCRETEMLRRKYQKLDKIRAKRGKKPV